MRELAGEFSQVEAQPRPSASNQPVKITRLGGSKVRARSARRCQPAAPALRRARRVKATPPQPALPPRYPAPQAAAAPEKGPESPPEEDPLAEQVRIQMELLVQEKARLAMENARLQRENKNLQELLMYHMVRARVFSRQVVPQVERGRRRGAELRFGSGAGPRLQGDDDLEAEAETPMRGGSGAEAGPAGPQAGAAAAAQEEEAAAAAAGASIEAAEECAPAAEAAGETGEEGAAAGGDAGGGENGITEEAAGALGEVQAAE